MILDNTITKIGALLLVGFGEAGSLLLSDMMNEEGDVNIKASGKKTLGIFGFCDIRQFTDTTEILQQDVMVFVNEIAQMVHGETHEYLGNPNKNVGDAFLLVWKFPPNEIFMGLNNELSLSKDSYLVNNYAESALIAILKIMTKLRTDKRILRYADNERLTARIPGYHVRMGFGLHSGWCIEGAIGSSHKIDATYLSHHVNFASTLEEKTKDYGVVLAASQEFHDICSAKARKYFRQVDCYRQRGSKAVRRVFTVDVDTSRLVPDDASLAITGKDNYKTKINERLKNLVQIKDPNYVMAVRLKQDPDLAAVLKAIPKKIVGYYKKMFGLYSRGEWQSAKRGLNKILKRMKDGPSMFLLEVMRSYAFKPPKRWKGVRVLD